VPRLGIRQYVLAGTSGQALAFGPGLDLSADPPGQEGTAIISGHRDTHFGFLRQLQFRDRLVLQDSSGRDTEYQVTETQVIDTRDTWLYPPPSGRHLLLVTCYPFDAIDSDTSLRYVVTAVAPAEELSSVRF
jgi:sortase A